MLGYAGYQKMVTPENSPPPIKKTMPQVDTEEKQAAISETLIRLAANGDADARNRALGRLGHSSSIVRAGAARALGYFEDEEVLAALQNLLDDPEERVNLAAINGLAMRRSADRIRILKKALAQTTPYSNLNLSTLQAIVKLDPHSDVQEKYLKMWFSDIEGGRIENPLPIVMQIIEWKPQDERTILMLRKIVKNSRDFPALAASSVRHLSLIQDSWVRKNVEKVLKNGTPTIRLAVVETLHQTCPLRRWAILGEILKEDRTPAIRTAAMEQVQRLVHRKSRLYARRISKLNALNSSEREMLKRAIASKDPKKEVFCRD